MKPWRRERLLWAAAVLVVALVVLAALPCGAVLHGSHDTCALCFLHIAEAPADVMPPSLVLETPLVPAPEGRTAPERVCWSLRTTRGPPRTA